MHSGYTIQKRVFSTLNKINKSMFICQNKNEIGPYSKCGSQGHSVKKNSSLKVKGRAALTYCKLKFYWIYILFIQY